MAESKSDILYLLKNNWLGHLTRTRIWLGVGVASVIRLTQPSLACRIQLHPSCVSNFSILFKLNFLIWLVEMNLEMFLAIWTRCWALHRQRVQSEVCLAPNVTPMKPLKRDTLTFTVAVRSILKFRGSIEIGISKQNKSDQLFEFQTEERIFPPRWRTNINKPPSWYHWHDLRCLQ